MPEAMKKRAAFIDRDGVINEERNYVHRIEDFALLPDVIDGLIRLRDAGFELVVVTNQAGIAHGYYSQEDYVVLTEHLETLLARYGVGLAGVYHCPHHPKPAGGNPGQSCACRKPEPGMLLYAAQALNLDLERSVMIGDKISDIQAGRAAGVRHCVLVASGCDTESSERNLADAYCNDLADAAEWVVGHSI